MAAIPEAIRLLAEFPATYGPEPPAGSPIELVRGGRFSALLTVGPSGQMFEALDEYVATLRLDEDVFGIPEEDRRAWEAHRRELWEVQESGRSPMRYYAGYLAGVLVGAARGLRAEAAVNLSGGSVVPEAHGRGVYRALVRARWEDAVAWGTPALTVQAGRLSRPVLERLGFELVSEQRCLIDRFGEE